jgi:membrane fusion protein, multidrug efflux system
MNRLSLPIVKSFYSVLLCLSIGLVSCTKMDKKPDNEIPKVVIQKVVTKEVPFRKELVGETVAEAEVDMKARVTGFIEKINFNYGSMVKKGQLLYAIEKVQYKAAMEKAKAKLMDQQSILKNALIDYNRQKKLYGKNVVSQRNFDQAETSKQTAEANVMYAGAELKIAETNLSYTDITAPITGKIGISKYSFGNLVGTNSGTLVNLIQLDPMLVEFNPDEGLYLSNAPSKKEMDNITIKIKLSDNKIYKHPGKIDYINNKVDPATGTIQFRALFPNPDNYLLPGQYVKVIIEKKVNVPSLIIPQKAVLTSQIGEYVYLVNQANIAEVRRIVTGQTYGENIVVESGLKSGDKIIIKGVQKVKAGQTVSSVSNNLNKPATEV